MRTPLTLAVVLSFGFLPAAIEACPECSDCRTECVCVCGFCMCPLPLEPV